MSPHHEINSREELEALVGEKKKKAKRICPGPCQQPLIRVFIKGVENWWGCKCGKIKAHHYI